MLQSMQLVHISTCLLVNRAGADARTVRPYMLQSMQLVHMSTYLFVNCAGADARTVRPHMLIVGVLMFKMVEIASRFHWVGHFNRVERRREGMKKAGAHGRLCFFVAISLWHVATRFAMNISRSCPAEHASWCSNG